MGDSRPWENGNILYSEGLIAEFDGRGRATINNVINAYGVGFSLISEGNYELIYFGHVDGLNYDETNSSAVFNDGLDVANDVYYSATILDEFDDSSIDSNIWTNTGWTEHGDGYIHSSVSGGTETITADQTNATDYKALAKDAEIYFKAWWQTTSTAAADRFRIEITDNNTDVVIKEFSFAESPGTTAFFKLVIDYSAETATLFQNGAEVASDIDISGASGNWYLQFVNYEAGGGQTTQVKVYYTRHIKGDQNANYFLSDVKTAGGTITAATLYVPGITLNGGAVTYQMSADNGGHYETVTEGQQHKFTYTGTQLIVKIILTEPATVDGTIEDNSPLFKAWGVKWLE